MNLLSVNPEECTRCFACMRACPVKALHYDKDSDSLKILDDCCIACGICVTGCQPKAIKIQDSIERVKRLLAGDKPVFAICDPDISAEFTDISDYRKFVSMLRTLGFHKVFSSAMAVEILANAYKRLLDTDFNGKYYITANCPVVVQLIEKYYPQLIANLAPLLDPQTLSVKMLRQTFHKVDVAIVYLSPCLAHKQTTPRDLAETKADAVLLFTELRTLFEEQNIHESQMEFSTFDGMEAYRGLLFPISNGILQAGNISEDIIDGQVRTTDGSHNVMKALASFDTNNETMHAHLNLFFCEGCVMGPGTQRDRTNKFIRSANVVDYAKKRGPQLDANQLRDERDEYSNLDLAAHYKENPIPKRAVDPNAVETIKAQFLFQSSNQEGLNCGYCGFSSCRALATHILLGTGTRHLCVRQTATNERNYQHIIEEANQKIQSLNHTLEDQQTHTELEKTQLFQSRKNLSTLINNLTAGILFVDDRLNVVEANQHFIQTIGEEALEIAEIIPGLVGAKLENLVDVKISNIFRFALESGQNIDRKSVTLNGQNFVLSIVSIIENHLVVAIFRQLNEEEIDIDEMVLHVQKTIDKHLSMVQEIGSILGEAASETEKDLNQIIQIIRKES